MRRIVSGRGLIHVHRDQAGKPLLILFGIRAACHPHSVESAKEIAHLGSAHRAIDSVSCGEEVVDSHLLLAEVELPVAVRDGREVVVIDGIRRGLGTVEVTGDWIPLKRLRIVVS